MKYKTINHDYYRILGVPKSASIHDIKKAYRTQVVKYHPDKGGSDEAIFVLNEAYETLKDPKKRADYDVLHALHFGLSGRVIGSPYFQSFVKVATDISSTADAYWQKNLQKNVVLAKQELTKRPLFQHAKKTWVKLQQHLYQKTAYTPTTPSPLTTLSISPQTARMGGEVRFVYQDRTIRTTLPKGLTDGMQIKLTLQGQAVWFVICVV